ncbi:MAG TPA: thioredoxin [Myxococcales bacterium]|nr:thioredoxin [Myxococcales bacterium]HAN31000.1 thioredoxin [Myxococcales bacterium]
MAGNTLTLTTDNFAAEVLKSEQPVLVDFWATWCGPCRMVGPLVEQLGDEYAGKAKVGKVDVDTERALAAQFQIQSIPAIMVFKGGEVVESILGAKPKSFLAAMLDRHID